MDKLKPCPFCGSDKVEKTTKQGWGISKYDRSRIECKNCGIRTRQFEEYEKVTVEEFWNRRVNNDR